MPDPKGEYAARLEARLQAAARQERWHVRIGYGKLAALVAGLAIVWLSLAKADLTLPWVLVPAGLYAALAIFHEGVLRARRRAERAAALYRRGIGRIEDRWAGAGSAGVRFRDEKHVYGEDLDLFGGGSLFELLSTARTPMGEACLARWLLHPSPIPVVRERQGMLIELRERLGLREDLALAGEELRGQLDPEGLAKWAESGRALPRTVWRWVGAILALAAVVSLVWGIRTSQYGPLLAVLGVEIVFWAGFKKRSEQVIEGLDSDARGLDLFAVTLARLERESFSAPRLARFVEQMKEGAATSSTAVRQLARIAYWIESRHSPALRLFNVPLLIDVQIAYAAERWRGRYGRRMRGWIDAVGEMEALLSLAGYSYEHPRDPFPTFVEDSPEAVFEGEQLGHPLIAQDRSVTNTVRLGGATRILMVSGSNMSGKSTLLRVVGVNALLAMAGAPIRGNSLRLSPLALGARLRTGDSLQENRSGFYTEVLRIRQVFELAGGEAPLLFLFDELLEGTNSKDRRIGADGLLRAFLGRGAIGIVTTHDLALTEIAGALGAAISNAHFQDYVEDGRMRFDYRLQPGVVKRSNALELMRLAGLEV